jgi:hypothetical protein
MRGLDTVPVDGSDLGVVPQREQFRAALVARDGVEGLPSRIDHDGIENVGGAAENFELNRGSFAGASCLDQCFTHRGVEGETSCHGRMGVGVGEQMVACRRLERPYQKEWGEERRRSRGEWFMLVFKLIERSKFT